MGCTAKEGNDNLSKQDLIQYEDYSKSKENSFIVEYYKLDWKTRPEICIFQKVEEQILEKEELNNIDDLFEIVQFEELKILIH